MQCLRKTRESLFSSIRVAERIARIGLRGATVIGALVPGMSTAAEALRFRRSTLNIQC